LRAVAPIDRIALVGSDAVYSLLVFPAPLALGFGILAVKNMERL
jgi:hypothetical protein